MKIFCIGFNKTATSTIHQLFLKNNLKSYHRANGFMSKLSDYDCFSDGGEAKFVDLFKKFYKKYPDSMFILNTRGLRKWILSRFKHGFIHDLAVCVRKHKHINYSGWAFPPTVEKVEKWITTRENFYLDVLTFFHDKPEQLIIVNIEEPNWINFLCDKIKLKKQPDLKRNVRDEDKVNDEMLKLINYIIDKGMESRKYNTSEKQNDIFLNNIIKKHDNKNITKLIVKYSNNIY
jgi:hypothetical protein